MSVTLLSRTVDSKRIHIVFVTLRQKYLSNLQEAIIRQMSVKLSNKFSSKNSVQEFNKGNRKMMPFMYFSTAGQNFNSSNK